MVGSFAFALGLYSWMFMVSLEVEAHPIMQDSRSRRFMGFSGTVIEFITAGQLCLNASAGPLIWKKTMQGVCHLRQNVFSCCAGV
jgi:hypothetical protein